MKPPFEHLQPWKCKKSTKSNLHMTLKSYARTPPFAFPLPPRMQDSALAPYAPCKRCIWTMAMAHVRHDIVHDACAPCTSCTKNMVHMHHVMVHLLHVRHVWAFVCCSLCKSTVSMWCNCANQVSPFPTWFLAKQNDVSYINGLS